VAFGLTACVQVSTPYEGVFDAKAGSVCDLLFKGVREGAFLGTADSSVAAARSIAASSGLDPESDSNLSPLASDDYVALCVLEVDGHTYIFYQLENPAQSGAIAKY